MYVIQENDNRFLTRKSLLLYLKKNPIERFFITLKGKIPENLHLWNKLSNEFISECGHQFYFKQLLCKEVLITINK